MSPRRSASDALATRAAILDRAVGLASLEGLEGVTIGRLAGDLDMSKSGVVRHFGSKEALQLAALDAANDVFRRDVWARAEGTEPGLERLRAICDAWIEHLRGSAFPGGCFLTAASTEFDGRPGPVRDAIAGSLSLWNGVLAREARRAVEAGDLPAGTDPDQVAFELSAVAAGLNQAIQLHRDENAPERARRAFARVLRG